MKAKLKVNPSALKPNWTPLSSPDTEPLPLKLTVNLNLNTKLADKAVNSDHKPVVETSKYHEFVI